MSHYNRIKTVTKGNLIKHERILDSIDTSNVCLGGLNYLAVQKTGESRRWTDGKFLDEERRKNWIGMTYKVDMDTIKSHVV